MTEYSIDCERQTCRNCENADSLRFDFTMAFQPIVDVDKRIIFGYEALVRGVNNESAWSIISQVNETNRYTFDQLCRVKAIALAAKLNIDGYLSINFLPNAIYKPERCIRTTLEAAKQYNFPIERIMFEFTEVEKIEDSHHVEEVVKYYQSLGFLTATDDFGAGYSGLNLLADFQTNIIKLDMALIRGIHRDPVRQSIVSHCLNMFKELKITVLAEGIEIAEEFTWLKAAKSALHSLQGDFSKHINTLVEKVIHLRMYVEAAIDFPDEEIDFLSDGKVSGDLNTIIDQLEEVRKQAKQGSIMREGMRVVIAGRPNAGKSSLLNALAGREAAIVTDIAGTTRDVLREHIHIDGMPLHIIDTAGLRESPDKVEQIGIERAWDEIRQADHVLFMVDGTDTQETDPTKIWPEFMQQLPQGMAVTVVRNKIDLSAETSGMCQQGDYPVLRLSAKNTEGVDLLRDHLKACIGFEGSTEGGFMARRRHLDALERAAEHLDIGKTQLEMHIAGEILAEELRLTQQYLNEITGEFSSDDLLGKIFSSFCIGK